MENNFITTNFIGQYFIKNLSICDELISLFDNSKDVVVGECGRGIDKSIKDSKDLQLNISDIFKTPILKSYFDELHNCLEIYKKQYNYCDKGITTYGLEYYFNIQKYKPSQGYHAWHSEKVNVNNAKRHLVFMTYLNDVKQGGETEWYYQKLKVKPKKGLTIIWPTDWTFTHKGCTTINEDKYIITGWWEFKE